ncbi:MAG TPA: glutamate-cysteine ligase family protein [Acidimicrobiales bacterium]|jgi:glutamate--cysteine ligase|nr:glutamate-cysteine ligase family protein [Acidimicrobiales bacterium]
MPAAARLLTRERARDVVAAAATGDGGGRVGHVGLEIELFPDGPVPDAVLPGGSVVTFEPGGQVELSGPCLPSADAAIACMEADLAALAASGVGLSAVGMRDEPGPRVLDNPRYAAMEAYFDGLGPEGRRMMRDTASLQVNVDGGDGRWQALHRAGPALAAAFANSPGGDGCPSRRLALWDTMDPTRCAPVGGTLPGGWVDYAMAARVMFIRVAPSRYVALDGRMTLADWVDGGHPLGFPDADDVAYHLTTLFPPVRPRGWLEVRFLDALPSPWWQAAVAAVCALGGQDGSEGPGGVDVSGLWREAARVGLALPALGDAASRCLRDAVDRLEGEGSSQAPLVREFAERFTWRRRCPADETRVGAWG